MRALGVKVLLVKAAPVAVATVLVAGGSALAMPGSPLWEPDVTDVGDHGEYVSWVARNTPGGPGHGAAVSAAARSDCGKAAKPGSR